MKVTTAATFKRQSLVVRQFHADLSIVHFLLPTSSHALWRRNDAAPFGGALD